MDQWPDDNSHWDNPSEVRFVNGTDPLLITEVESQEPGERERIGDTGRNEGLGIIEL